MLLSIFHYPRSMLVGLSVYFMISPDQLLTRIVLTKESVNNICHQMLLSSNFAFVLWQDILMVDIRKRQKHCRGELFANNMYNVFTVWMNGRYRHNFERSWGRWFFKGILDWCWIWVYYFCILFMIDTSYKLDGVARVESPNQFRVYI